MTNKPPAYARPFPDVQVGDFLFACPELDESVRRYFVFRKDDNGFIQIISLDCEGDSDGKVLFFWGAQEFHRTAAEAVRNRASFDVRYHKARFERAQSILAALDAGKPYEHLMVDLDD